MSADLSYLSNSDGMYLEALYNQYKSDPQSVEYGWRKFFEGFEFSQDSSLTSETSQSAESSRRELKVRNLIFAYRNRGHLFTKTNPVRERRKYSPTLALANFGLNEEDLDTVFQAGAEVGLGPCTLREILELLNQTYCQSIGVEFLHLPSVDMVEWLRDRMESSRNTPQFTIEIKKQILRKLNQAVAFESFLGSKYVGEKRFSLEGAETLIPALDAVIEHGNETGIQEFMIGMAHRGRLNVLANILNKTYEDIFSEFEGNYSYTEATGGDVKYHMGFSSAVKTDKGNTVHLSLCPNPSHLEAAASVAEGMSRAKIDLKYGGDSNKLATIILHGDASIAGQGLVYEIAQMSELDAYKTGGTIHIVINNQVGFTTNFIEARSSIYCTDVAKVTQSPIFHVNGDDAEAVAFACNLAMDFRLAFHKDVYIDLLCYRRHGHNEGDEPRFTQPSLYAAIDSHPNPREIYFRKLVEQGDVDESHAKELEKGFKKLLQERLNEVKESRRAVEYSFEQSGWKSFRVPEPKDFDKNPVTGVGEKHLRPLAEKLVTLPENLSFYDKFVRINEQRRDMLFKTDKLDWAMGELLAYASLLSEGYRVRMSGQDVERGTFAHRHAIVKVNNSEEEFISLANIAPGQGKFEIYNSHLSEYAVLGFEFGYSWSAPETLVLWEAQFGDFVNGAQIIIDQYITSALTKWKRLSGLVMLLPHGFEGQGPEHSSGRMERFLELASGFNIQVANCTSPANFFHLLRRQMVRDFRVPLVVFSPKSLLRHPEAVSSFKEFTSGTFTELFDDASITNASKVKRVVLCTGKIYYELLAKQKAEQRMDVAILRLEQIYPIPRKTIRELKKKYGGAEWVWVQEEPENMGAWPFLLRKLKEVNLACISRLESASPAVGYKKLHEEQQKKIISKAFELNSEEAGKSGGPDKILASK